jgi:predicted membrane protein
MKKSQWFWGIFFVLAAAVLVATQMGWTMLTLNPFTVIATIFLVAILVANLMHLSIGGTVFPLAFLLMLYSKPLGITSLVPWTILLAAVLLTIGLSLIFHPYQKPWKYQQIWVNHHRQHVLNRDSNYTYAEDVQSVDDNEINIETSMGSGVRYVQSKDLKKVNISNYMGATKIYFDHATITDVATANVDCHLGGITLYIPRDWDVVTDVSSVLAGIDERGVNGTKEGPTLYIKGKLYLSGLTIYYI